MVPCPQADGIADKSLSTKRSNGLAQGNAAIVCRNKGLGKHVKTSGQETPGDPCQQMTILEGTAGQGDG